VFVTSGDGFWAAARKPGGPMPTARQMQDYGRLRTAEALRATAKLGVPAKDVIFLGFPDGSTHFLWQRNWDSTTPLHGVNGAASVPYAFAMRPGAPYSGAELLSELESVVQRAKPTTVLLPDPADVHRDHWAIAAFSQTALVRAGYSGARLTYLIHRSGFPRVLGMRPDLPLDAPEALGHGATSWLSLPLGADVLDAQRLALREYATQEKADGRLVDSFVRSNGLLGSNDAATLATGTLALPHVHDRGFRGTDRSAIITAVDLSRSATATTLTLRLAGPVSAEVTYDVQARSIGAGGEMRFYEGRAARGVLSALRYSASSVQGTGALVGAARDSVSVRIPAELMTGAKWLLVSADTSEKNLTADHAAVQLVRVVDR
jgi:LmbE family N-acetylglucosaminyl deacetylase